MEVRVAVFEKEENRMKNRNTGQHHITRRIRLIACISVLGTAFMIALPQVAHAQTQNLTPPSVPDRLQEVIPEGNELFLIGHAFGTQDYVCAASGSGVAFVLTTPEAVLFDTPTRRVVNHYFSPNPVEGGTIRATWQSTRDSSVFWGKLAASATFQTDPDFVAPDAIAWLTLSQAGVLKGVGGGNTLAVATFVQRVNTVGGLAPSIGCNSPADIGKTAFVPYEADYVFYTNPLATAAVSERN
jgi:Protein of unknown function (DUF3455)